MTAEWEHWEQPSRWRRWALRLLALLALAAVAIGLYVIYQAAIADDDPEPSGVSVQMRAISGPAETLAARLEKLRARSKPAPARKAAKRAIAKTRDASRAYDAADLDDTNGGGRISTAIDAEREFLNAVSATLAEPSSRLRQQLPDRAGRARRALSALPDDYGLPATVRGVKQLRAWARANDG